MRRTMLLVAAMAAMFAAVAVPAAARPGADPTSGNDKVTICHATRSLSNKWVVITIDAAAWQGTGPRAHGDNHDRTKTDSEGNVHEWTDKLLTDGEGIEDCGDDTSTSTSTTTTQAPRFECKGADFDLGGFKYGALFPNLQLVEGDTDELTALAFDTIPAGTYAVTLFSWDTSHPDSDPGQLHEQWAANFDGNAISMLSEDLDWDKGATPADAQSWYAGEVKIPATNTITAQHRSIVVGPDGEPDSVIPLCVGLNELGG